MSNGWQLAIDLTRGPAGDVEQPLFLRLARAISDDVRRGRLKPGDALPGSRTLAEQLGVHRNTVLAAYAELAAEGWIATTPAAGTFVSTALPDVEARRFAKSAPPRKTLPQKLGFALREKERQLPAVPSAYLPPPIKNPIHRAARAAAPLAMSGGVPDVRLLPTVALARAYRRALARHGDSLLNYGDARGHASLRAAVAGMLSALRGVAADVDDVMITRGSQQALDLVARALLQPGDVVAVEALGYRPAWEALAHNGARLVPVPVDAQGLDVDALGKLAERQPLRAVYVTPHHQYPTTAVLAAGRRLQLLALARAHRFAVIEDDYDFEFHYDGKPVLPLASADVDGVVVYIGTLSKILAPGLRLGFLVAPRPLLERVTELRLAIDRQGDHAIEHAVAELIDDGELQRHARRMRRVYQKRRDALVASLTQHLGDALELSPAPGGMALWARARRHRRRPLGRARLRARRLRPSAAALRLRRHVAARDAPRLRRARRGGARRGGAAPHAGVALTHSSRRGRLFRESAMA
jgi:GntR family transcriptional regulator / MocR family aminotransferase